MSEEKKVKVLQSEYLFNRPWLTVRRESIVLPNGNPVPEYYVLEYPEWVNTIAITRDRKFVFIRQYRHGLGCGGPEGLPHHTGARYSLYGFGFFHIH